MTLTTSHLSLTVDTESGQQSLVKLRLTEVSTAFTLNSCIRKT